MHKHVSLFTGSREYLRRRGGIQRGSCPLCVVAEEEGTGAPPSQKIKVWVRRPRERRGTSKKKWGPMAPTEIQIAAACSLMRILSRARSTCCVARASAWAASPAARALKMARCSAVDF